MLCPYDFYRIYFGFFSGEFFLSGEFVQFVDRFCSFVAFILDFLAVKVFVRVLFAVDFMLC